MANTLRVSRADVLKALEYPHLIYGSFVACDRGIASRWVKSIPTLKMAPEAVVLKNRLAHGMLVSELLNCVHEYIECATFEQVRIEVDGCFRPPADPAGHLIKTGRYLELLSCWAADLWYSDAPDIRGELKKKVAANFPPHFEVRPTQRT